MRDVLAFHPAIHGQSICPVPGRTDIVERRPGSLSDGLAFSARPVKPGQRVCVELRSLDVGRPRLPGSARIGFTRHDPLTLSGALPPFAVPDLTDREGFWARPVGELAHGSRITVFLDGLGSARWEVDGEVMTDVLLDGLPTDSAAAMWLIVDLYGSVTAARLIPADDVPTDILARGPTAVNAYQTACTQSGTSPCTRIQLVLVGRDAAEKTRLCRNLNGFSDATVRDELSCSVIDLSASYRYGQLAGVVRSPWKPAGGSSGGGGPELSPPVTDRDILSADDERSAAIANNILLLLLQLQLRTENQLMTSHPPGVTPASASSGTACDGNDVIIIEDADTSEQPSTSCAKVSDSGVGDVTHDVTYASHELLKGASPDVVRLVDQMMASVDRNRKQQQQQQQPSGAALANAGPNLAQFDVCSLDDDLPCFVMPQVFLSHRAVYVFMFDLRHDLEETFMSSMNISDVIEQECTPRRHQQVSGLEYFDFWLNCVHSFAACNATGATTSDAAGSLSPPIFIVGTHRNELHCDAGVQQKMAELQFEKLRRMIHTKPYKQHVTCQYHAVDNKVINDSQIVELRCALEEMASRQPFFGERVPSRWLSCEQTLKRLVASGVNFCSLGQLREVAVEEGMQSVHEFRTWIQFCHDRGITFCDPVPSGTSTPRADTNEVNETTVVVLYPFWLMEACRSLFSADSQCCVKGILYESLLGTVWSDCLESKSVALGILERSDVIVERCRRISHTVGNTDKQLSRSFLVPSRVPLVTTSNEDFFLPNTHDVVFYICFSNFLPDSLFNRVIAHCYRWSQNLGGDEPQVLQHRARFFLDNEHDFVLETSASHLARIKVSVLRVVAVDDLENSESTGDPTSPGPRPHAAARVRNFLESVLCELRESWMKRLSYSVCVQCVCDRACPAHRAVRCGNEECLHFLDLDQCLSNKIVCCDYRRVPTTVYRKGFPSPPVIINPGPILPNTITQSSDGNGYLGNDLELPSWVKSSAKMLNGGADGQDWVALAKKLGYKRQSVEKFNCELNPGLALLTDWIISSGNTALSIDLLISYLEQLERDDIVEIVQKGQEVDVDPPQVFISYQWDIQDEVTVLRDLLEKNGFTCWMDIGQMGGGDNLYSRIYEGIKQAKVVIACLTPRYVTSHHCNKEITLADLLHKPIVPVMYEQMPWPPGGAMSLIFAQLVYINLKCVGGHGGSGIHADLDDKYREIIARSSNYTAPHQPRPYVPISQRQSSDHRDAALPPSNQSPLGNINNSPAGNRLLLDDPFAGNNNDADGDGVERRRTARDGNLAQGGRVQQVHVTKCAVCTLL